MPAHHTLEAYLDTYIGLRTKARARRKITGDEITLDEVERIAI
jgi:hypothetical protein